MEKQDGQICYSYDGETFDVDPSGFDEIRFIGKTAWSKRSDFFNAHSIVEGIMDSAVDQVGDFADDYLVGIEYDIVNGISDVMCAYMEEHFPATSFFSVKDVVEVEPYDPNI